jgi:tetratricopeptide (TPR) repeat protein
MIGGILIGIALVLGILLRVLLVPSGEPGEGENQESTATTSAPASEPVTTTTAGEGTTSVVASPPVGGGGGETVEHYFDQALSYLDAGRLKEARTNFLKVLELDPQNSRAKTRLSLLEEEIDRKAEQHFDNARQAFNFLRYEEAIAEWEMFMHLVDSSDSRYAEAEQGIAQARAKLR